MQSSFGESNLFQLKSSSSLHNINNQLFRITLLADMLSNDVNKSELQAPQISDLVNEIKSAAFDVAKSGRDLMTLIRQHREIENSELSETDLESL